MMPLYNVNEHRIGGTPSLQAVISPEPLLQIYSVISYPQQRRRKGGPLTEPDNPLPMHPYRLVFAVRDRDGNEVRLTESQWHGHILPRHPDVEP